MSEPPKRRSMHAARKRRIWEREGGVCWICRQPVPMEGPEVRYDHRGTLWITQSDDDAGIFPIHRKTCDEAKTPQDQRRIAKTKRQAKKLGVAQSEQRPAAKLHSGAKLRPRPFPKGKRTLRSRNTFQRRK